MRTLGGIIVGAIVWAVSARGAFGILGLLWSDNAAAVPSKSYTLAMLLSRLAIAAGATAAAGYAATLTARDRGRAAWLCGGLLLAVSLRPHLVTVWADYPVWYHVVYLGYLLPIAGFAGSVARSSATRPAVA